MFSIHPPSAKTVHLDDNGTANSDDKAVDVEGKDDCNLASIKSIVARDWLPRDLLLYCPDVTNPG